MITEGQLSLDPHTGKSFSQCMHFSVLLWVVAILLHGEVGQLQYLNLQVSETANFTEQIIIALSLSTHIAEVPGSNLSGDTGYPDWGTGYGFGRPRGRSSSPCRGKIFHFSTSSRPNLGPTQPPIQWVPGVKRPEREADHSPPTSAEVKIMWIYKPTPPYVFMA
jgi:hypothetical protein